MKSPHFPSILAFALMSVGAFAGEDPIPAWSAADLEADWLVQARMSPENIRHLARIDAAGVVDGVKSSQMEHQTKAETWTWWQVDLGASVPLDRVVVHNPQANVGRQAWFKVLISRDGKDFTEIHCLEGPTWPANRQLTVKATGHSARWVRISAGGRDRLRLSEVEVFAAPDPDLNIALNRPADQSSFVKWRKPDPNLPASDESRQAYPLVYVPAPEALARGLALATSLDAQGVDTSKMRAELGEFDRRWKALPTDAPVASKVPIYLSIRRSIRALALAQPRLATCDRILFLKRRPNALTAMHQQFHGWYAQPGGGIWVLEGLRGGAPRLRHLTPGLPPGDIQGLELSFDGKRVLFAYAQHFPEVIKAVKTDKTRLPEESFYHLHELDLASGTIRKLTQGRYDDLQASYLPGGDIVFMSTRRGTAIQATAETTRRTMHETTGDSFIRCGGEAVRTQTLHRMAGDGSKMRVLSPFETPEWYTALDQNGRIIYARWDYVDRDARIAMNLWSCNPDGTNPEIVFGNHTRSPYSAFEARPVPGTRQLVFTGSSHHGQTGGPLLLLDPSVGIDGPTPLTSLTPEVCNPEIDGFPLTYYQAPWPLHREVYLCAWSAKPLFINNQSGRMPPDTVADLGIYYYDIFGNRELLHRDPTVLSTTPVPWVPRAVPPQLPELPTKDEAFPSGRFLIADVYQGLGRVPRGSVKRLRLVGIAPKVQPTWCSPPIGVTSYDAGKFVLGTVPVEADGSAYFVAPAGVSLWFQLLGADHRAIQTMRSATYLQPGELQSCVGCHEYRRPVNSSPIAARREPSLIQPDVEGSWPLRFETLMRPMLDRLAAGQDEKLAGLGLDRAKAWDLVDGRGSAFYFVSPSPVPQAWKSLVDFGGDRSVRTVIRKHDVAAYSPVGQCMATVSPLWEQLTAQRGLILSEDERRRLALWLDLYGQIQGHFSAEQEAEITQLRERWKGLLEPAGAGKP